MINENSKEFFELDQDIQRIIRQTVSQNGGAADLVEEVSRKLTRYLLNPNGEIRLPPISKSALVSHFTNGHQLYATSPRFNAMIEMLYRGENGFVLLDKLINDVVIEEQMTIDTLMVLNNISRFHIQLPELISLTERLHNKTPNIYP